MGAAERGPEGCQGGRARRDCGALLQLRRRGTRRGCRHGSAQRARSQRAGRRLPRIPEGHARSCADRRADAPVARSVVRAGRPDRDTGGVDPSAGDTRGQDRGARMGRRHRSFQSPGAKGPCRSNGRPERLPSSRAHFAAGTGRSISFAPCGCSRIGRSPASAPC